MDFSLPRIIIANFSVALLLGLASLPSSAQPDAGNIPEDITAVKGDRQTLVNLRSILDASPAGCALDLEKEDSHPSTLDSVGHVAEHYEKMASNLLTDSVSDMIFNHKDVPQYQRLILIESLGIIDLEKSEMVLRNTYTYSRDIAESMYPGESPVTSGQFSELQKKYLEFEKDIREASINSNYDEIKIAVLNAIARSGSSALDDILVYESQGGGRVGDVAKQIIVGKSK